MSWHSLSRRAAFLGTLALLAACEMTPAFGPNGAGTALYGRVQLREPEDIDGFALNRHLSERLGPEQAASYALNYRLTTASVAQGITPDDVTTRYSLNGTADFVLTEQASGQQVTRGQVSTFTSYSTTGTTIATMSAEQDAHDRLARMLADQVVTRLLAIDPATLK